MDLMGLEQWGMRRTKSFQDDPVVSGSESSVHYLVSAWNLVLFQNAPWVFCQGRIQPFSKEGAKKGPNLSVGRDIPIQEFL